VCSDDGSIMHRYTLRSSSRTNTTPVNINDGKAINVTIEEKKIEALNRYT
jgi:hypothetical protein